MKKVLIIEDDDVLRENTSELLDLNGYYTITAPNGAIGVSLAKNEQPDIIVCDIMMPELDGYGVLKELSENEETNLIPFIFLSAKTERKDVRLGMNLGADDYITKPFEEEELTSAIESRLAKTAILSEQYQHPDTTLTAKEDAIQTLEALQATFRSQGMFQTFSPNDIIYEEGQNSNYIYLVVKGIVKTHQLEASGKELITSLMKADDFFGFSSFSKNQPYHESATAIEYTELYAIPKDDFFELLKENHKLVLEFIELLTSSLFEIKDELLDMAYSSVRKKTAQTILKFAEKLQKAPEQPIRICRNDLASVAGIATESLIRTLSSFKKEGLIAIEGRNIRIVALEKLARLE